MATFVRASSNRVITEGGQAKMAKVSYFELVIDLSNIIFWRVKTK